MRSGINKLIHVGLLGVMALLITTLAPGSTAKAQIVFQPAGKSWVFFGVIKNAPNDSLGIWRIGTEKFVTDSDTELDERHGALVVGACVRVDARHNRALRIVGVGTSHCMKP